MSTQPTVLSSAELIEVIAEGANSYIDALVDGFSESDTEGLTAWYRQHHATLKPHEGDYLERYVSLQCHQAVAAISRDLLRMIATGSVGQSETTSGLRLVVDNGGDS